MRVRSRNHGESLEKKILERPSKVDSVVFVA